MPRWRALPEELDPQIREFASQLRRLVDRSGMSVATIADRTGYSKSSWERYLNGRLLPPRGATQALAEVTGTDVRHLGTMWELAERAWSRSEMRHDVTMEAIQVAQARAALGEFGDEEGKGRKRRRNKGGSGAGGARSAGEGPVAPPSPAAPSSAAPSAPAPGAASGGYAASASSAPSSASHSPTQETSGSDEGTQVLRRTPGGPVPADRPGAPSPADRPGAPGAPGEDARKDQLRKDILASGGDPGGAAPGAAAGAAGTRERARRGAGARGTGHTGPVAAQSGQQRVDLAAWGAGPGDASGGPGSGYPGGGYGPGGPATTVQPPVPPGGGPDLPGPATPGKPGGGRGKPGSGRRRVTMFLAGVVGALVVVAAAVLFFDLDGSDDKAASPSPSPTKKTENLPSGVKCSGKECSGKDPEAMGCGGQYAKTTSSAWVGPSYVEVRYSKVCKASWARITSATADDALTITAGGGQSESDKVKTTNDAYTQMVSVKDVDEAKACATLAAGGRGCTTPGKTVQ